MINTSEQTISALIQAFHLSSPAEKALVKQKLLLHYYALSSAERSAVRSEMEPFLTEIEREMIAVDPVAQEVNRLLNRLNSR